MEGYLNLLTPLSQINSNQLHDDLVQERTHMPPPAVVLQFAMRQRAAAGADRKKDPTMDWEEIREKWFFRLEELFGGRDISERELFPLVEKEWRQRYGVREIPSSAFYGVTHHVPEKCRKPHWTDMAGYHHYIQQKRSGAMNNG
jgi:hypothetical protein